LDLTNLQATLEVGQTYTISFDRTTCGDYYLALNGAWVDWDQDLVWEDSEKLFAFSQRYGTNSYTFTVPATATLGATRMRLQAQETAATTIDPCAMFEWGDTKDYTIVVVPGASRITCPGNPNIKPANGNAGTCLSTKNFGQTCTQKCNTGYELTAGSLDSICGANGEYSLSNAVCSVATAALSAPNVEAVAETAP
jgi:hypothetical protein